MIANPMTGELLELNTMNETELIELREMIKATLGDLKKLQDVVEARFITKLQEKGASKYLDAQYRVTLEERKKYEYDVPLLLSLRHVLPEDQFEAAVKIEYKPNKTQLNKLVKFGGEVREIIEGAITEIQQPPTIKVERLKEESA